MNPDARVVLVGLTPGWAQMERAFRTAKLAMAKGLTGDELFDYIKKSGSFSGPMRKNLVSMLDGIGLNQHLKLTSCSELFGSASELVHFTSAVSAPTFVDGENFSGHGASFLKLAKFRQFIIDNLAKELALLPNAIVIPLGKIVDEIIGFLHEEHRIDPARCLIGFPHPSGANPHRKQFYEEAKNIGASYWQNGSSRLHAVRTSPKSSAQQIIHFFGRPQSVSERCDKLCRQVSGMSRNAKSRRPKGVYPGGLLG